MDVKVSRKELRMQPSGATEVLTSGIFDYYPVFSPTDPDLIVDLEMLDDDRIELLDRSMFAVVKQRGTDPIDPESGSQWAESIMGEVPLPVLMTQVQGEVRQEGPGVKTDFSTLRAANGKEYLQVKLSLTDAY